MMSDDMLSQDEIDALLKGGDDDSSDNETQANDTPPAEEYLTSLEQDALGEVGNISFGSSATALSTLLNQKVDITTPTVSVVHKNELDQEFPHPHVAVQVEYTDGFQGANLLVIKETDAAIIADLMLGGDGRNPSEDMGEIQLSAVQEAMNQMMGSAATSMSTVFNKKVDISPPSIDRLNVKQGEGTDRLPDSDALVQVSFNLKVGDLIDSNIMQLLPVSFAKDLVDQLLNPPETSEPQLTEKQEAQDERVTESTQSGQQNGWPEESNATPMSQQQQAHSNYQQPMGQQQGTMGPPNAPQHLGSYSQQPQVPPANIQPAAFSSFDEPALQPSEASNLSMLLDIPLQVTVELGRTKRSVKEILELSPGSIIELDKLAGEPVDILVNNKLIAKGEVVVIEENFGVRVTDIISQTERMKRLQ